MRRGTRFWELLAGATLACIEADAELRDLVARLTARPWVPNVLAIAGALMIAAGVMLIDSTRVFPGLWVLLPVAGTFFLLVAGDDAWLNRRDPVARTRGLGGPDQLSAYICGTGRCCRSRA